MEKTTLGNSDLLVSKICLGTMTFGEQNTQQESHNILDAAIDCGVNFIDTAECYPVAMKPETQGDTERIIGNWLKNKRREDIIIASKITGVSPYLYWIREGKRSFRKEQVIEAVNQSLQRLGTDYIDLYQLHWPDRNTIFFGERFFDPDRDKLDVFVATPWAEILEALDTVIKQGKIRYAGVSNETSYAIANYARYAEQLNLPRITTIQNGYSLVNRLFETELHEACYREHVSLLAYSPTSFGTLTGKYIDNPKVNGRMNIYPKDWNPRYIRPAALQAVKSYYDLAKKFNLTPAQLALGWVYSRPFVSSTIIGGTSVEHIKYNCSVDPKVITPEIEAAINELHLIHGDPAR